MVRVRGVLAVISVTMLVLLTTSPQNAAAADTGPHTMWRRVWSDEFDGRSLNADKWNAEYIATPRNNELEYYIPRNVIVHHGHLSLISKHESYEGQDYTSAAVDTYQKFSFTYGKVVIRAKLPRMGQGIWPALWMLGTGCDPVGAGPCPWPGPGANEVDNLEAINTSDTMYMTPHYGGEAGSDQATDGCSFSGVDLSAGYHRFAVVWKPGGVINWKVDGVRRCHRVAPEFFTEPMYLIFNTAIGGSWPGDPDETTPFPQSFDIDYVRVFQAGCG